MTDRATSTPDTLSIDDANSADSADTADALQNP